MIALIIILAILLLILCLSVGVDAAYDSGGFVLKLKLGPVRLTVLPKSGKKPKQEHTPKPKPEPKEKAEKEEKPKKGLPFKITLSDIRELLGILFRMLGRLRRGLSVDVFMLHLLVTSEDPYDAVKLFGNVNAVLSALSGPAHRALKIRSEDIQTCVDFEEETMIVEARIVLTLQIWEILYAVLCAGCAAAVWFLRKKREDKQRMKLLEQQLKAETVTKGI